MCGQNKPLHTLLIVMKASKGVLSFKIPVYQRSQAM